MKTEVAHQDFHGATGINHHAPEGSTHNGDAALLTQRIEQVERSVNRILPIVRKILYTVSERNTATDEGMASEHRDAAH